MFEPGSSGVPVSRAGAEADDALRRGLNAIPVAAPSPDFNAAVLARLAEPEPWWQQLRSLVRSLRPALAAATLTAPAAAALIVLAARTPGLAPASAPASPSASAQALPIEQALDRSDLTPAALRRLSREESSPRGRTGQATTGPHTA